MFGTSQQVLLIRQNVIEDEKLGGDGVALSSSSTTVPLLTNNKKTEAKITAIVQGQAAYQGSSTSVKTQVKRCQNNGGKLQQMFNIINQFNSLTTLEVTSILMTNLKHKCVQFSAEKLCLNCELTK